MTTWDFPLLSELFRELEALFGKKTGGLTTPTSSVTPTGSTGGTTTGGPPTTTVTTPQPVDFAIDIGTPYASVQIGNSVVIPFNITWKSGTAAPVALSLDQGLGNAGEASSYAFDFNPLHVEKGQTTGKLSITILPGSKAPVNIPINIVGVAGGAQKSAGFTLDVVQPGAPSGPVPGVGLEVWNQTTGADQRVGSIGSTSSPGITVTVGDSILLKQPAGTSIPAASRVDIYTGDYGQPGHYVDTVFANADGYWEYSPGSLQIGTFRAFVYVNNQTYSDGLVVTIAAKPTPGNIPIVVNASIYYLGGGNIPTPLPLTVVVLTDPTGKFKYDQGITDEGGNVALQVPATTVEPTGLSAPLNSVLATATPSADQSALGTKSIIFDPTSDRTPQISWQSTGDHVGPPGGGGRI